jgi:hypothetical protein
VTDLSLSLPESVVNEIAEHAAQLVVEQLNGSPWMTRRQAALYLGCPLSRLEKDKTIPLSRWDGRCFYDRRELDEFMQAKRSA